jgi:hypothetical protein
MRCMANGITSRESIDPAVMSGSARGRALEPR